MTPDLTASAPLKDKTLAAWLAFLGGPLGLHRFYLHGWGDLWGWLHPIPTALGLWGLERLKVLGQDDALAWWLLPLLALQIAQTCLTAILYALRTPAQWNGRHNPDLDPQAAVGQTRWLTVGAIVGALMVGAVALMSGLALGIQHYVESEVSSARSLQD
jgi:hypothetical protein